MSALCRLLRYGVLAALLLVPAALPAAAGDTLAPQQKAAMEQVVHDYILSHPEIIVEALKAAQSASDDAAAAKTRQALRAHRREIEADPDSPVGGDPKGDVTLVEFFDYSCPYCKAFEPSLETLLKQDPHLRIVYKEFPILGPASVYAARVALAAAAQGKYGAFHRRLLAYKGSLDDEVVRTVAMQAGLDPAALKSALAAPRIDRILRADYALADALDIDGTPAFIIGDTLIPGVPDLATLRTLIAAARHRG